MKKIAVVCGGDSGEYDISVQSGKVVASRLDSSLYEVYVITIQRDHWYYTDDSGKTFAIDKMISAFRYPIKRFILMQFLMPYTAYLAKTEAYRLF